MQSMQTCAEELPQLFDDLRTAIVEAGWFSYAAPDPVITIMLDEMELPEGVTIIATTLDQDGAITNCPSQILEAALQRMWAACWALTRVMTRTTIDEKGSSTRCSDMAGTRVPPRAMTRPARVLNRIRPRVAWSSPSSRDERSPCPQATGR
jgi:hypothetical protein